MNTSQYYIMSDMESARRGFGSPIPWMVALNVIGVNLIAPVLPAYASHFGVGFAAASTLVTVFALARMSLRLTAGSWADRYGSRIVCIGGGAVQTVGALLAVFAPSLSLLLAARAIQGMGSALFGTSINRYLLVITGKAELGRATASFQGGILLGSTIGPLVGGIVAVRFGIFAPFYVQATIAGLLAIVSSQYIRDGALPARAVAGAPTQTRSFRSVLEIRGFKVIMFLGFGLFFLRAGAISVLIPAFADVVLDLSPAMIGFLISLGSIASLIAMPIAGQVADRFGRIPVALAGAFSTAATVTLFGLADSAIGMMVISALLGLGIGLAAVALPTMIGDIAPSGTEGRASAVYRMANDLGWVVGPVTLGLLADSARYGLAFAVAGLPLVMGGAILLRWRQAERDVGLASR
ncbi:MAG: MFS transporter [Acidimicrobiia bacterium]|nr:MFS transporter [Acidimicrobiia bacterium]